MAEIINLRRAKKAKARAQDAKQAEQNRVKFGTAKTERDLSKARADLAAQKLDRNKLEKE